MSSLIGQRIRELRLARGLTQTQLALDIVTPSMISQIEAGKANPSEMLVKQLAERLETTEETLLLTPAKSDAVAKRMEVIQTCLLLKRYEEAEQLIDASFDTPTGHVELHYFRAQLFYAKRQLLAAYRTLQTAIILASDQERHNLLADLYILEGDILFAAGDLDIALYSFEQAKRYYQRQSQRGGVKQAQIYMRLSECNRLLHREKKAFQYAEFAANSVTVGERSIENTQNHLSKAIQFLKVGKEEEAGRLASEAKTMHQILAWFQSSFESDLLLIMHMLDRNDINATHPIIASCITKNCFYMAPELHTRLKFLVAETHVAVGHMDDGIAILDEAIAEGPDVPSVERLHALSHAVHALVYHNKHKLIEFAEIALHDALYYRRLPIATELSTILSRAYLRMGKQDLADQVLHKIDQQIHSAS